MNASLLQPMSREDALRAAVRHMPWRVRLVFVGKNSANKSGRSDKWWEASGVGLACAVRWGATETNGQTQKDVESTNALGKVREKLAKGYQYDSALRVVSAPPPATSLQDLVNRATWRPTTPTRALLLAGEHGFVALALDIEAVLPGGAGSPGLPVRPFLAADGSLWGIAENPEIYYYSRIRVPSS